MTEQRERPLEGRTILLTRPPEQGAALARLVRDLGGEADLRPTVSLTAPRDAGPARATLARLERYDWLLFTSANGVRFFFAMAEEAAAELREALPSVACIGPATARALEERGVLPALVAARSRAEGLADALIPRLRAGQRVLLVRPEVARPVLPRRLEEAGVGVDAVAFYRNVPAAGLQGIVRDLRAGRYDAVVFTAPSALGNLLEASGRAGLTAREALGATAIVVIGEVTARAVLDQGLPVAAVAKQPSDDGIAEALGSLFI
jgi:uroporphyrinogen III methyltransferase/synthase